MHRVQACVSIFLGEFPRNFFGPTVPVDLHDGRMASYDRINLSLKTLLVQYTAIAPVIDVGGTLHAGTTSLFFLHKALKTQNKVADHELNCCTF